jgi:hypothetical protein
MPLVDTEMTQEQEEDILGVAPKDSYIVRCVAIRVNEETGTPVFTSEKSGKSYMKVAFQLDDDDPKKVVHKGKFPKDYNAVKGTGFMAMLRRAFPQACIGSQIDTDLLIGLRCVAKLKVSEYEGVTKNEISALLPLKD